MRMIRFDAHTADEEAGGEGEEQNERSEAEILGSFVATTIADLEIEKDYVAKLLALARKVQDLGHESKFEKLKGIIEDKRFRNEKLLVFTEHRDTLTYLEEPAGWLGVHGPGGEHSWRHELPGTGRTGGVLQAADRRRRRADHGLHGCGRGRHQPAILLGDGEL